MRTALFAFISGWLLPLMAGAGESPVLVVFELEDRGCGIGSRALKNLSASLSGGLTDCGHQVIAPAQVPARLRKSNRRVPRKRMDQARLLKARRTLVGSVGKKHSYCRIDAFLMDVQTGARLKSFSAEADCNLDDLTKALPTLTAALCRQLQSEKTAPVKQPQDVGGTLADALSTMEEIAGLKTRVGVNLPKGKKARVSIISDPPGAEVSWDGKPMGKTPLQIEKVEPRHYRLRLTHAGYTQWREIVRVTSSIEMTISLFLDNRVVLIKTRPPGARVYINGDRRGRAPIKVTLPAGRRHEIRASLTDHEETFMEFIARPASAKAPHQEVTVELTPKPIYLMLDVSPDSARVVIGQEQLVGSGTVGVIPGKRKITASAEGYQKQSLEVDIPTGKPFQLQLRLKRLPAYFKYQDTLNSKRLQAWTTLTIALVTFSASGPMIKWSRDSDRASEEWGLTDESKSQEAEDRALWTGIVGYGAVGIGVLALGWSLYSFLTYPEKPSFARVSATGNRLLLGWDF